MGAERVQVGGRQNAASRLHIGGDAARQIALIEIAWAGGGKIGQRRFQSALRQPHAGFDPPGRVGRQPLLQIGGGTGGIAAKVEGGARNHQGGPPIDQQTFGGEIDAKAEQWLPWQFGVAAMRLLHAGHHARHRDRQRPVHIAVGLDPRPGEQVGRRGLPGSG